MSTERKNPSMMHIGSEVVAALCSAFLVSPTNAILDRSVIEYANGKQSVNDGVRNGFNRLFTTPLQFFTSFKFKWMFFVYGMTYGASNLADHVNLSDSINHPIQKLGIVFIVNTICGILKDKAYIQKFGTSTTPKIFPPIALVLLFARDLITMASAFTFPPIIGKLLQQRSKLSARAS